jgi:hypothetical protein
LEAGSGDSFGNLREDPAAVLWERFPYKQNHEAYAKPGGVQRQAQAQRADGLRPRTISPIRGLARRMSPAAGSMIVKTFFLAKEIHRILTRSLRGKKSLRENPAEYRSILRIADNLRD